MTERAKGIFMLEFISDSKTGISYPYTGPLFNGVWQFLSGLFLLALLNDRHDAIERVSVMDGFPDGILCFLAVKGLDCHLFYLVRAEGVLAMTIGHDIFMWKKAHSFHLLQGKL